MKKIKTVFETTMVVALLLLILGILIALWFGAWQVIFLTLESIPYLKYSLKMMVITFWTIMMYEIGLNHLSKEIIRNWKSILFFIGTVAFYILTIMSQKDPETGYSPEFDFQFYLTILLPTITAMLIGLYRSKKK